LFPKLISSQMRNILLYVSSVPTEQNLISKYDAKEKQELGDISQIVLIFAKGWLASLHMC
jgi:hypothetical protein